MSVNTNNEIIAPTINSVKLNYKQKFPTKDIVETINGVTVDYKSPRKQLNSFEAATLKEEGKYGKVTKEEFDDFCKNFLFEELKGNDKLGEAFCEKYKQTNYVLSILNNRSAKEHIKTFYVK